MRVGLSAFSRRCPLSTTAITNTLKIDKSRFPKLEEKDLEEHYIAGWGPGGQNVNKATNCCQLKHKPTGIIVKVHKSRVLEENRQIARMILAEKVDIFINGENSVSEQKKRLALKKMDMRDALNARRREMKAAFKDKLQQELEPPKTRSSQPEIENT